MKITKLVTLATIVAALAFAGEGCKKKPVRTTALPGQAATPVGNDTASTAPLNSGNPLGTGLTPMTPIGVTPGPVTPVIPGNPDGTTPGSPTDITNWDKNRDWGTAFTIYFDFDRSVVKPGEASKLDAAAAKFKNAPPAAALLIEGHCDERGTAEYNRALGERRAMAIREKLIAAGISPEKVHTVTFGKDKPALMGHDESAWSKNRRGEFILCTPPK